ncbi:MAG TPA: DMT family transporter [Planctomycetota bacterium]|nr:DMT family transporter [Planctomycetota bacterium]
MSMNLIIGGGLSLASAILWAISPLCYTSATKRIGSLNVNLLRMAMASFLLLLVLPLWWLLNGQPEINLEINQLIWLTFSGVLGMVVGDYFIFEAYESLGPRLALQINTVGPAIAVAMAWYWLDEVIPPQALIGCIVVLAAIAYILYSESRPGEATEVERKQGGVTVAGVVYSILAAVAGAAGAVAMRQSFMVGPDVPTLLATVLRVTCATAVLWAYCGLMGKSASFTHLKDGYVRSRMVWGTVIGPVASMFCYVTAFKYMEAGKVSTITALSPLFMIPIMAVRYGTPVRARVVFGTIMALAGVAMICLKQ